ncbi:alpha-L-rhamnosidase [Promicromonospora umidemergens]|uniref:alpha-L-rhamnosidase n=1 Tax=Promicromonospora umidemergens TaxID=629679 RepID=A0ABP8XHV2_9MICO|nr:family 78 glycoside hydrolase catalytic domain [Promicromonospora umidemergens]MCP2285611.1 alpha-L-rhamnosidase [Promicromonospora umidemergens]
MTALVTRLRLEQSEPGAVLGTATPRLSWVLDVRAPGWASDRYEVELQDAAGATSLATVPSGESVLVDWPFAPLAPRGHGRVRVRVGSGERWTPWSDAVPVEVGLLGPEDWSAAFVSPVSLGGLDDGAPLVFTDFDLDELPVRARLYASAHGVYEASLNGGRVGDDVLAPGWTAYEHRLRYQVYDVLTGLRRGPNTLSALVGNGWYRGQLVWPGNRSSYGSRLAFLAQLELEFADGSRRRIVTDGSWRASRSGILFDDLYDGERRDLRVPNVPDRGGSEPVEVVPGDLARLVARRGPAVRVTDRVPVAGMSASGGTIVDFGQNLVGWVELVVRGGRAGDEVTVRHAEVLEEGELAMRPLRSAKATASYVLSGADVEVLRPTFTFNGFRYAEICGLSEVAAADVTALVLGSDLRRTAWFESSDPDVDRLYENVVWSMRGNFLDLPTDCPQRDERLGWTGDIQVFAPTAATLFDTSGFLAGWLEDLAAEQRPDGGVPYVVPDVLREPDPAAAGWSDAATVVPSVLHLAYADHDLLARQYPSMRAWVDKVAGLAGDGKLWRGGFQFGDWLDPAAPPDDPAKAAADPDVVATAYFARSAGLLAAAARTLGHDADADRYRALADETVRAFNHEYVTPGGRVLSDCQTVYALALCWDLVADPAARGAAGDRLVELVVAAGYRVATGFLGTPLVLDALCVAGRPDVAYRMLLQKAPPSWLYAVTMGATTIWERWDSMLPDGRVNPGDMTSFNHYAYGAVADWLHRCVGGLAPTAPGWRRVEVRPLVTGQLAHARTAVDSPYGRIESSWRIDDGRVLLVVEVPYGVTAEVWVPGAETPVVVGLGTHRFEGAVQPGSRPSEQRLSGSAAPSTDAGAPAAAEWSA